MVPFGNFDAIGQFHRASLKGIVIVVFVAHVHVERKVIDMRLQITKYGAIPTDPIRIKVRRSSGDHLDFRVGPMHQFGGFKGELAIIVRRPVAHLPGTIHFVSKPPIIHLPRLVAAVLFAEARGGRIGIGVDIFHPLLRFVPSAGAEIGAYIGLGADFRHIVQSFVGTKAVVFHGAPSHFEAAGSVITRANTIAPVVIRREVPTGPA